MKKSAITLRLLEEKKLTQKKDRSDLEKVANHFSIAITQEMLVQIKDKEDPVAKQFIPSTEELIITPEERSDPIGDEIFSPVKGIIHRYPDRCLFIPVKVCPVYCRFCFRKEKVGRPDESLSPDEMEIAFQYIENHPHLWEVILTGGDPLILKPVMIKKIVDRLSTISHLDIIRIHTRIPVVNPARITTTLLRALESKKTIYIIIHANHPQEFSDAALTALEKISAAGIPLLSQTTLLKNVNDNIETLSQLMRLFVKNRIKPYYLHHADLVPGTSHFRTSIEKGQTLVRELRGRFSGICQPTYVLDIPGGHGKVPIGPNYLKENGNGFQVEDYLGNFHHYNL